MKKQKELTILFVGVFVSLIIGSIWFWYRVTTPHEVIITDFDFVNTGMQMMAICMFGIISTTCFVIYKRKKGAL